MTNRNQDTDTQARDKWTGEGVYMTPRRKALAAKRMEAARQSETQALRSKVRIGSNGRSAKAWALEIAALLLTACAVGAVVGLVL